MSSRYELTDLADQDLFEISLYIAQNSVGAAERFIDTMNEKFQLLADSPRLGRSREELAPGLRSLSIGKYVIFYRPTEDSILVIRVLHGARDIETILGSEETET